MNGCRILIVAALLMLVLPMTAAAETTNVTIGVNEYIVLNNDIYIEVLDVDVDFGRSAKVHFRSYLDSVGTKQTIYSSEGEVPTEYTSGTGMKIRVTLDSVSSNAASFTIESSKELIITDRYNFEVPTLTPSGLAVLVGLLSLIAISMIKRRNQD